MFSGDSKYVHKRVHLHVGILIFQALCHLWFEEALLKKFKTETDFLQLWRIFQEINQMHMDFRTAFHCFHGVQFVFRMNMTT